MASETHEHHVAAEVHGRYLVDAGAGGAGAPRLVGFHGYGEDAAAHLAALRRIPGAGGWLCAAIEALHPFYTKRGEVVASWMTKRDRERAIEDNVRYVAAAVADLGARYGRGPLVFAGFSQGVAMAYRAAAGSGHASAGLIALAGDVPPDVAARPGLSLPPVLVGRGSEDAWYDQAKMDADLAVLAGLGVEVTTCVFPEGHVWGADFLVAAGAFLERVAASAVGP